MAKRTHKSIMNLAKSVRVHKADGGETDPMLDQDTSIYDNPYKDQVLSAPEPMTVGQYLAQAMRKPHETNIRDFPQDFQNLAVVQGIKQLPHQLWEAVKFPTMARKGELQRGIDPHTGQLTWVTESGMGPTEAGMVGAGLMSTGALPDVLAGKVTPNVTRIFAGEKAATADLMALEKAKSMLEQGKTPTQIIKETGWFQGPDQKWRFEIPDRGAKIVAQKGKFSHILLDENGEYHGLTPNTVLGNEGIMEHPKLLEAYPQLSKVDLAQVDFPSKATQGAYQSPTWNDYSLNYNDPKIYLSNDAKYPRSTLLHELQHAVQDIENFPRGSSSNIAKTFEDYQRAAGEVEARNVQSRSSFTPEEIKSKLPWETQDTPYNKQLVSYKNPTYDQSYIEQTELPGIKAYHGTDNFFDEFDPSYSRTAKHIYATPIKEDAQHYGQNVQELNMRGKVGDFTPENRGIEESKAMKKAYKDHGLNDYFDSFNDFENAFDSGDMYQRFASQHAQNAVMDALFSQGYDVLKIPDAGFGGNMSTSLVAKDPSLIDIIKPKKDVQGFEEGGTVKNSNHSSGLDNDFMLHFLGSTKERLAKMSGQHTGKRKPSAQNAIDLAKHVMRTAHAYGGLAGRSHFEDGGAEPVSTASAEPTENDYIAALDKIFQKNFGRPFDAKQDKYWLDQLKSGKEDLKSLATLETDIKSGAQGADKVAMDYAPTLQNLYRQYFGRDYNPETDSWWAKQLASGAEDPANLARDVLAGRQGKDLLYYNTYNTLPQDQPLTPVQQNPSRYVGMPTGRIDTTPAPTPAPATAAVQTAPAAQQYGTYAGEGTTPFAPQPSLAQNYAGTPWDIHAVQNYMSPNPMLGYQFNAPNLISAPLMTQHLANSGGAGMSNVPTTTTNVPTYTTPATDMTAFQKAYNDVMTNPDYVPTAKKTETTTTQTPTYTNRTDALAGTTNPNTAAAAASYLASQAATDTGLPAQSFASPVNTGKYTPVDIPVSAYKYTPESELPSTSAGYEANLASARANPVVENALQGAVAAGIPGFKVAKQGGRITKKNKPSTGAFIKKALVIVSKNKPKRPVSAG